MRVGKNRYIKETIEVTAEFGLENVTVRRISGKAGVSEAALYRHFKDKEDLINKTFLTIDEEVSEIFYDALMNRPDDGKPFEEVIFEAWKIVFDFLQKEKSKTLFLIRYRYSSLFTDEIRKERVLCSSSYDPLCKLLADNLGGSPDYYRNFAVAYVFELCVLFSEKILMGRLERSPELEASLWKFMLNIIPSFQDEWVTV
ncbi:MAG: TetR/AcrR family transcriptional regulator [Firmicutes bacterium]|nr:TetR/AcrR family transcriptional regulator [Bacillota bacterium]